MTSSMTRKSSWLEHQNRPLYGSPVGDCGRPAEQNPQRPRSSRVLEVSGGIPPKALDVIEAAQPYNGTDDGRKLDAINDLDIFDSTGY